MYVTAEFDDSKEGLIPWNPIGLIHSSGNIRGKEYHVNREFYSCESNHSSESAAVMMSHCSITRNSPELVSPSGCA